MKRMLLLIFCVLCLCLVGCGKHGSNTNTEDSAIYIYCPDANKTGLLRVRTSLSPDTPQNMVLQLLGQMKTPILPSPDPMLPTYVDIPEVEVKSGIATLKFQISYAGIPKITEIVTRAGIVKTLCQLEAVDSVEIYCNGQPLLGKDGLPVGRMHPDDFIDSSEKDSNYEKKLRTTLYFANAEGNALIGEFAELTYHGTESEAEAVIMGLFAGPKREHSTEVIPEKTKLLHVEVKDGICTVNLNSAFLSKRKEITEETAVYALVNSLCEIPEIYRVNFLINGESVVGFKNMSLFKTYERNLDIVESE